MDDAGIEVVAISISDVTSDGVFTITFDKAISTDSDFQTAFEASIHI